MTNNTSPAFVTPPAPMDKTAITKTVAGLLVIGAAWAVSHQAAVITVVAMLIVWLINVLFKFFGKQVKTAWLTTALYVVSIGMAFLFSPVALPTFPAFTGDPTGYAVALVGFVGVFMNLAAPAVASATGIYNILFKDVFDQISSKITA